MSIEGYEDITPNKDGGVLKQVITNGNGKEKPLPGVSVKVHYVGTLNNGEQFDSSRDRGSQFEFVLGKGQVIKGWDIGVATMTRGEKANFIIRGDYAYGKVGSPPKIPADTTLNFEVELFDWTAEDISPERDGSIRRLVIQPPVDTIQNPIDDASVLGIRYTYGNSPPPEFNLPPNAELQFTVFLKEFEKEGKLRLALSKYKRVEEILEFEKSGDPEQKKEREELLVAAYLNLSLVYSKLDDQTKCVWYCNKALETSPENIKALYRKGSAQLAMNEPEFAASIFNRIIELEPTNKAALQQLKICKSKLRDNEERDKKRFKGMFEKMAKETAA